ncbi:MAG: 4-hydroxy-3-methylbut-2-enyl diphosphate reductase [Candidatus Dadabacteria bacterium]|nr:MAG: 4-hydroxy-3-methylbut-2-enyl diphosphate reductase [Candidatus Dadabacteria bacterium]
MARIFDIPEFYRSSIISVIKQARRLQDHRKRDLSPSILALGPVTFKIARHFGFCFGVENAIEIAYRAIKENPGRRIYLLSEMIHNPHVNQDLISRGVKFIYSSDGTQLVNYNELSPEDIVIVPAFGTTVELFRKLREIGINPQLYNTTCPFVEKVWKRAAQLGEKGFAVVIHGKHSHEETKATFSHARLSGASMVIRDIEEAKMLASFIRLERDWQEFDNYFAGRYSEDFVPEKHLQKLGVVNQTTMLASETHTISRILKEALSSRFGEKQLSEHFADTRDTLCYATSENQNSIKGLLESGGDLAVVVGGYNSSNTSHLVELLEQKVPTYYIKDDSEIISKKEIRHLDLHSKKITVTENWLPENQPVEILITAGASCPDVLVDRVITTISSYYGLEQQIKDALRPYQQQLEGPECEKQAISATTTCY